MNANTQTAENFSTENKSQEGNMNASTVNTRKTVQFVHGKPSDGKHLAGEGPFSIRTEAGRYSAGVTQKKLPPPKPRPKPPATLRTAQQWIPSAPT